MKFMICSRAEVESSKRITQRRAAGRFLLRELLKFILQLMQFTVSLSLSSVQTVYDSPSGKHSRLPLNPATVIRKDRLHLSLLQHYLRNLDSVRIHFTAPREKAA